MNYWEVVLCSALISVADLQLPWHLTFNTMELGCLAAGTNLSRTSETKIGSRIVVHICHLENTR
jgi:hypothetical protein